MLIFDHEKLHAARKAFGMPKAELARRVGVTPVAARNWERGVSEPDGSHLIRLARVLGLSAEELYREEDIAQ